jgi:hypothetical protein
LTFWIALSSDVHPEKGHPTSPGTTLEAKAGKARDFNSIALEDHYPWVTYLSLRKLLFSWPSEHVGISTIRQTGPHMAMFAIAFINFAERPNVCYTQK